MKVIVTLAVDILDDQLGVDFQRALEAVKLTLALNGMHARVMRTEFLDSGKPPPKINSRGPMPGHPS